MPAGCKLGNARSSDASKASFGTSSSRRFLFLQGPVSPYFAEVAAGLRRLGHHVFRVNLNRGDRMFWRGPLGFDFTGRPEDWAAWIDAFMAEHDISDVFLHGEQRFYHRIAVAAAKARGIAVTVTEWGYLRPDWIILERDGTGPESLFPGDPTTILQLAQHLAPIDFTPCFREHFPSQAWWDILYHLGLLIPFPFRHFKNHELILPLATYAGIGLRLMLRPVEKQRSGKILADLVRRQIPFWLFTMQIETDFSLRAYSDYPDMDAALDETLTSFAAHAPREAALLVKLHPLDPRVKNWPARIARMAGRLGVADRVHFAPHGELDAMLQAAKGMITVNSTSSSRALFFGKPVKLLGRSIFDIPDLTFQGRLDAFWAEAKVPDPKLREAVFLVLASAFMVRGGYFSRAGLDAAVAATVERLDRGLINLPLPARQS
jgi:capsular polysaccharide export protein